MRYICNVVHYMIYRQGREPRRIAERCNVFVRVPAVEFGMFQQKISVRKIVIIEKKKNGTARSEHSKVLRGRYSGIVDAEILQFHPGGEALTDLPSRIRRTIVHHDSFIQMPLEGLARQTFERTLKQRGAIEGGDNDANERRWRFHVHYSARSGLRHPVRGNIYRWERVRVCSRTGCAAHLPRPSDKKQRAVSGCDRPGRRQ